MFQGQWIATYFLYVRKAVDASPSVRDYDIC